MLVCRCCFACRPPLVSAAPLLAAYGMPPADRCSPRSVFCTFACRGGGFPGDPYQRRKGCQRKTSFCPVFAGLVERQSREPRLRQSQEIDRDRKESGFFLRVRFPVSFKRTLPPPHRKTAESRRKKGRMAWRLRTNPWGSRVPRESENSLPLPRKSGGLRRSPMAWT